MNYQVNSLGEEHQKALDAILSRAATDKAYREKLKTDPASAIQEESGLNVPEDFDIRFVENEADMTVVLPDFQSEEISDEALESVAGGAGAWIVDICNCDNGDNDTCNVDNSGNN